MAVGLQEMLTSTFNVLIEADGGHLFVCVCVCFSVQIESDLGCPGGKARIIHKESDIITAFAINKVQQFNEDVAQQHIIL